MENQSDSTATPSWYVINSLKNIPILEMFWMNKLE